MEDLFPAEFWKQVRERQNNGERHGQAVFNTSAHFYPTEARRLSGTFSDPFYHDNKVPAFLTGVVEYLTR